PPPPRPSPRHPSTGMRRFTSVSDVRRRQREGTMQAARTNELLGGLARAHHGLIHRDQVRREGISQSALLRRVGSGLLEQVGPSVYRLCGAPVTWDQRALLACWTTGPA